MKPEIRAVLIQAKNRSEGGLPMICHVIARCLMTEYPVVVACDGKEIKRIIERYEFIKL